VADRRVRRRRSAAEKRRIVELTLVPGASVALVARAHGVNANQVVKWRRDFERGELSEPVSASASLLPVMLVPGSRAIDALTTKKAVKEYPFYMNNSARLQAIR
jgi:transposase-like protein